MNTVPAAGNYTFHGLGSWVFGLAEGGDRNWSYSGTLSQQCLGQEQAQHWGLAVGSLQCLGI